MGNLESYRNLPQAKQTLLILVEKEMGLGPAVALDLFAYMTGRKPDFPATLSKFQLEDLRKLAFVTHTEIKL